MLPEPVRCRIGTDFEGFVDVHFEMCDAGYLDQFLWAAQDFHSRISIRLVIDQFILLRWNEKHRPVTHRFQIREWTILNNHLIGLYVNHSPCRKAGFKFGSLSGARTLNGILQELSPQGHWSHRRI